MLTQDSDSLLSDIAAGVASHQLAIEDARKRAENVVLGEFVDTTVGRQRVLRPTRDVEAAIQGLVRFMMQYRNTDQRRWAAVLTLVFALLASRSVDIVKRRALEVFQITDGEVPAAAEDTARAIIDAITTDPEIAQDRAYCTMLVRYRPSVGQDELTR